MCKLLQAYYYRALPELLDPEIIGIEELRQGWETEIHIVELAFGPTEARQRCSHVLRVYPGENAIPKARREYDVLQRLRAAGYPVPTVHALAVDGSPLGKPFLVMERVHGTTMSRPLFDSSEAAEQERLLTQFCQLMLGLHQLDWRPHVDDPQRYADGDPYRWISRELERLTSRFTLLEPLGFSPLLEWLLARRHEVPCLYPGVIHWDFHPNNVLLRPDGSAVVLDWAQADVSDPRVDLGWTLILIGSERGIAWRDRILSRYEELAGEPVEQIEYFEVLGYLKRLAVFALVMHGQAATLGLRPDLAPHIARNLAPIRRLYERLLALVDRRIPEIERLLAAG